MITLSQALRALLMPFVISALLAALGRWRRWNWMMPAAVGTAFLVGYGLLEVPRWRPIDGTDWLFWLAIPTTLLAVIDSILHLKRGWLLGAAAGVVAGIIIFPVVPGAASLSVCWVTAVGAGVAGIAICFASSMTAQGIGAWAVLAGLLASVGGAAIVVLASDSASVGIRGLAGAAALAPLVGIMAWRNAKADGRVVGVAVIAITVITGVLAGGHFYAGVTWLQFAILMLSPLLLLAGSMVPVTRPRLAGVVAVIAVLAAVTPIVIPAVIAAKHAAETNATDGYGY